MPFCFFHSDASAEMAHAGLLADIDTQERGVCACCKDIKTQNPSAAASHQQHRLRCALLLVIAQHKHDCCQHASTCQG